ncbi:hypothetical protein NMT73_24665, partial [Escherichia coli]|nr:hypothetical protein [Escherichia coli]
GWVRTRQGHGHDATQFTFKAGDTLYDTFECRTTDALLIFGTRDDKGTGRVYSVAVANLPGGRGDGVPLTTLIELAPGTHIAHTFAGHAEQNLGISTRGGNGFLAKVGDMVGRQKAGKAFLTLDEGDQPNKPAPVPADAYGVACLSEGGRLLLFQISELKTLASGGRG